MQATAVHARLINLVVLFFIGVVCSGGTELDLEKARQHWAYRLPQKRAVPEVRESAWARTDIDRFILHRLEARQLSPGVDAGKEVLVRRLYFDLIGLPPTPEEIECFITDADPKATERLVEKLLASPHFGERWGRHWLDVARYGESVTLRGLVFSEAWRYRDYVIDSFNRDLPFDQFIQEQISGDLLPRATLEEKHRARVATTFLVLGNFNYEEQDKEQLRMDIVDEQLDTIGKAFLAQTIGCARCHDHKFDPIPTRDYYAMAGILKNTKSAEHANVSTWLNLPLPLSPEDEERVAQQELKLAELQRQIRKKSDLIARATSGTADKDLPGIVIDDADAKLVGAWKKSQFNKPYFGEGYVHDENEGKGAKTATFLPELKSSGKYEVRFAFTSGDNRASKVPVTILHSAGETTVHVNERLAPTLGHFVALGQFHFEQGNQGYVLVSNSGTDGHVIADAVQFLPVEMTDAGTSNQSAEVESLKKELEQLRQNVKQMTETGPRRPMAMSIKEEATIADCQIHLRGSVHRLGATVPRGFLQVAYYDSPISLDEKESGRRELAAWIASPSNPLTARVIVNRAWHWLMGAGLVRTTDNFGTTGDQPSHPELLDFLAVEFVENGWSIKRLVRAIVLARAYQTSSVDDPALLKADPENHLFGRARRKRLDPELMRDAMLAAGGKLELESGGPTVKSGTTADYGYLDAGYRRSVYVPAFRNALPQLFELFDFTDTSMVTGQRTASVVAPQALFFLNHPFVLEQSRLAAGRLLQESSKHRVQRMYRLILGRSSTSSERQLALNHLTRASNFGVSDADAWTELCQALFASVDFRFLD